MLNHDIRTQQNSLTQEITKLCTAGTSKPQLKNSHGIYSIRGKANLLNLSVLESFVARVLNCDEAGFRRVDTSYLDGRPLIKFMDTSLSCYFKMLNSFISTIYDHDTYYIFSEHATLFLEVCNELDLHMKRFFKPTIPYYSTQNFEADIFNEIISLIRKTSKSPTFKRKYQNSLTNAKRMKSSIDGYVKGLFSVCSRLLVLRIDLTYRSTKDDAGQFIAPEVSLEQAHADLRRLLRNMRHQPKIFQHMLGYVWRLEFGATKQYHYHWIFFYDNSQVCQQVHLGNCIGEYWVNVITDKRGDYFNCNAKRESYKFRGIGKIHAESPQYAERRNNLSNIVIPYLLKREQYPKLKLGKKFKLFGKGVVHKKKKLGRPRKDWASVVSLKDVNDQQFSHDAEYDAICY